MIAKGLTMNREDSEHIIRLLAERYTRCFFEIPQQRRPLKKTIVNDLEHDGFPVSHDLLIAAVDWYRSHLGYLHVLQAGVKRIDLHGNEAGTVTEAEQRHAQNKIEAIRAEKQRDVAPFVVDNVPRRRMETPVLTKMIARPDGAAEL